VPAFPGPCCRQPGGRCNHGAHTGNINLEILLRNYQSIGARFWHYVAYNREEHIRDYIDIIDQWLNQIHSG
jgi:hypothetical protein